MKAAFFAMVLGLGMGLMGCATDVDDPVVPAPAPEEQRDPPKTTLSGELRDPQLQLISGVEINRGFSNVPPKQILPLPTPTPEQH
jgi:hypothetical protein